MLGERSWLQRFRLMYIRKLNCQPILSLEWKVRVELIVKPLKQNPKRKYTYFTAIGAVLSSRWNIFSLAVAPSTNQVTHHNFFFKRLLWGLIYSFVSSSPVEASDQQHGGRQPILFCSHWSGLTQCLGWEILQLQIIAPVAWRRAELLMYHSYLTKVLKAWMARKTMRQMKMIVRRTRDVIPEKTNTMRIQKAWVAVVLRTMP